MRNRQRGSNLGLVLLASQVFQLGLDKIPPVTLATLGLNVYLFLFPLKPLLQVHVNTNGQRETCMVHLFKNKYCVLSYHRCEFKIKRALWRLKCILSLLDQNFLYILTISFRFIFFFQTCLSVQEAYWYRDWHRLLLSPFHHVDDMHLYFNMASLLWKGINLERKLGGPWFAYLLSVFSLLTGLVYLLLETALTQMTDDATYSLQCAVGFSGERMPSFCGFTLV